MKIPIRLALVFFLFFSVSCKKECYRTAVVIRDCTGTYLQISGKDFKVCNVEKVSPFAEGTILNLTFNEVNTCPGSENEEVFCSMNHATEGCIEDGKIQ